MNKTAMFPDWSKGSIPIKERELREADWNFRFKVSNLKNQEKGPKRANTRLRWRMYIIYELARESRALRKWASHRDAQGWPVLNDVGLAQARDKKWRKAYIFLARLAPELAADTPWVKIRPNRLKAALAREGPVPPNDDSHPLVDSGMPNPSRKSNGVGKGKVSDSKAWLRCLGGMRLLHHYPAAKARQRAESILAENKRYPTDLMRLHFLACRNFEETFGWLDGDGPISELKCEEFAKYRGR